MAGAAWACKLQEAAPELKMLPPKLCQEGVVSEIINGPAAFQEFKSSQAAPTIGCRMTLNTSLRLFLPNANDKKEPQDPARFHSESSPLAYIFFLKKGHKREMQ